MLSNGCLIDEALVNNGALPLYNEYFLWPWQGVDHYHHDLGAVTMGEVRRQAPWVLMSPSFNFFELKYSNWQLHTV